VQNLNGVCSCPSTCLARYTLDTFLAKLALLHLYDTIWNTCRCPLTSTTYQILVPYGRGEVPCTKEHGAGRFCHPRPVQSSSNSHYYFPNSHRQFHAAAPPDLRTTTKPGLIQSGALGKHHSLHHLSLLARFSLCLSISAPCRRPARSAAFFAADTGPNRPSVLFVACGGLSPPRRKITHFCTQTHSRPYARHAALV